MSAIATDSQHPPASPGHAHYVAHERAAGVDPAALVEDMNDAQAQRAAARAELDACRAPELLTEAEVYAMLDSLGDVRSELKRANPARLEELFAEWRLEGAYNAEERTVDVTIRPLSRVSAGVRGGT
ncbi:hypothetical protein GCM10022247_05450 [Allokutzneria multivorans]|uniref:Uncharacterized protein n=1 Tax=Allokutzneria multivorans TaxID=1142134 RepID=A0ABP7QXY7_9PSEU